ncbi:CsbD family protein (plasmid) [Nicoliella spurrieriana]|uniref:CsbD family protein n=1 Tax=Nicoliella spurrieriana TaxID=2925830 RepID=A0A976RQJ1_9LACO|nr:CsbD family protein [Nicoliella spurrieriana]UQS85958.1 CsbD family protein [Nicoliella spurrieriana]
MSLDDEKDKLKGKFDEAKGKLTGDKVTEAKGKAEGFLGKAKDAIDGEVDKVKDKFAHDDDHSDQDH